MSQIRFLTTEDKVADAKRTYTSFQQRYPGYAKDATGYEFYGRSEIKVCLGDRGTIIYDDVFENIAWVREDSEERMRENWEAEFSRRLRRMIAYRFSTQAGLSEKTGIEPALISRYCSGLVTPSIKNINKIATALNCSVSELIEFC